MKKKSIQKLSFQKQVISNLKQQKGGDVISFNSCWCVPSYNSCDWFCNTVDCPVSADSCWCLPTRNATCVCLPTYFNDCSLNTCWCIEP
jgi:hypothetical protein